MASQIHLLLLLASLCLVASATSAARFSPDGSPIPSPSFISLSPGLSPELAPSPSESSSSVSPDGVVSFGDAPARFDELPTTSVVSLDVDLSSSSSSGSASPFVSRICDNTDHPALCIATAAANQEDSLDSVLRVSVEASNDFAKKALEVVKQAEGEAASPELKATLKDCKNSYDTAVENFGKTIDAFAMSDVGTMRSVLSATITFVGDCEDGFKKSQAKSPVSKYAETLTEMTSNCLAIVAQMMNH